MSVSGLKVVVVVNEIAANERGDSEDLLDAAGEASADLPHGRANALGQRLWPGLVVGQHVHSQPGPIAAFAEDELHERLLFPDLFGQQDEPIGLEDSAEARPPARSGRSDRLGERQLLHHRRQRIALHQPDAFLPRKRQAHQVREPLLLELLGGDDGPDVQAALGGERRGDRRRRRALGVHGGRGKPLDEDKKRPRPEPPRPGPCYGCVSHFAPAFVVAACFRSLIALAILYRMELRARRLARVRPGHLDACRQVFMAVSRSPLFMWHWHCR